MLLLDGYAIAGLVDISFETSAVCWDHFLSWVIRSQEEGRVSAAAETGREWHQVRLIWRMSSRQLVPGDPAHGQLFSCLIFQFVGRGADDNSCPFFVFKVDLLDFFWVVEDEIRDKVLCEGFLG